MLLLYDEREFMHQDASAITQNLMKFLFPEQIANEFVENSPHDAGTSTVNSSAIDGAINIHNLPVSFNDISHEIPSRIQCDHPIDNVIGQLSDGVRTRGDLC